MILNQDIGRLIEVDIVSSFVAQHKMTPVDCRWSEGCSLLLTRTPYVVEFQDALIENYLDVTLADLSNGLLITGSSALGCSIDMGLQNLQSLKRQNFDHHPLLNVFLSFQAQKMGNLYSFLGAIDALMERIEEKGLVTMLTGGFDEGFDFSSSVEPLYPGMLERYRLCINSTI